jgi:hypothetical protein
MSGHAHGLAISSVQRWHLRVWGAAADVESASRVLVYLCFAWFVYKTRTHKSEFHAKEKANFSWPSF